jgi:hypothetical protein
MGLITVRNLPHPFSGFAHALAVPCYAKQLHLHCILFAAEQTYAIDYCIDTFPLTNKYAIAVYTNAYLASLNSREGLRERQTEPHGFVSVHLSRIPRSGSMPSPIDTKASLCCHW